MLMLMMMTSIFIHGKLILTHAIINRQKNYEAPLSLIIYIADFILYISTTVLSNFGACAFHTSKFIKHMHTQSNILYAE